MVEHPTLKTIWSIRSMQLGTRYARGLDIKLVIDTTSPAVIEAIEKAARNNEIDLVRESAQDEP